MKRICARNAWERRKMRDEVSILSEFFSEDNIFQIVESIIKWQTGEPKNTGEYLVCLKNGRITTSTFLVMDGCCGTTQDNWQRFNEFYITAWCSLSNIEPYNEE